MQNFIVRIYRHTDHRNGGLVGTVETVGDGRQWAFKTSNELWAILQWPRQRARKKPGAKPGAGEQGNGSGQ